MTADVVSAGGRRIVICTFGSPGDLLPYLAVGRELRRRGHEPVLATSEVYRARAEAMGLGFVPVRPDRPSGVPDPDLMVRVGRGSSPAAAFQRMFLPDLPATFADTLAAVEGADLVLSHSLAFAAGTAAARFGIPWASAVVNPLGYFSRFDPPEVGPPIVSRVARALGPGPTGMVIRGGQRLVARWSEPWRQMRADAGLPPGPEEPVFDGQHSPLLSLALFSPLLGAPQPDWPTSMVQTGFAVLDDPSEPGMDPALLEFLDAGSAPVVFTLGTTAVMEAGTFYRESARAIARLGARAVFLTGSDPRNLPPALPPGTIALPYAPHGPLFARALATVHQGGVGTLAKAMRGGAPMVVVPYGHDQPDNAGRAERLGIARRLDRGRYRAATIERVLGQVLVDTEMRERAAHVGRMVRQEVGARVAADAIERVLGCCRADADATPELDGRERVAAGA